MSLQVGVGATKALASLVLLTGPMAPKGFARIGRRPGALYRTKAETVVCETPFQIRKAIVAMAQDDGARIHSLASCTPGRPC